MMYADTQTFQIMMCAARVVAVCVHSVCVCVCVHSVCVCENGILTEIMISDYDMRSTSSSGMYI